MDNLITKLEAASGPDKELDRRIFIVAHDRAPNVSTFEQYEPSEKVPAYTASLDAAMTLVPEGSGLAINRYWVAKVEDAVWSAVISTGGVPSDPARSFVAEDARTAALAISTAALKARGAQTANKGAPK